MSEAPGLIDKAAEPKKWGAYRLMYAQAAEGVDPEAAMSAYRESIPVWDPEKDHAPLASCHYGLGALLFARVVKPADMEEAIPHLEFAAGDFPYECATMLALLYNLRLNGDPLENWKKRTYFLEVAIGHLSPEENGAAWGQRRNDLATAWTSEPGGDFSAAMERRIENQTETLARLSASQDPATRRVVVETCMQLSEAYEFRVAGMPDENQTQAVRYARLGVGAATEQVPPDTRAQARIALGRALLNQKKGVEKSAMKAHLHEALDEFRQAGLLFDWNALPVLASTLERFQAIVYAALAGLGEVERLEDMMSAATSSYDRLVAAGDPPGGRTVMLVAAEALIEARQFSRAIPCLQKAAAAGEMALAQATSRAGRLERIWDLHDAWALLAYCFLETGAIPEAVEALDRGKARLWRTTADPATAGQMRTLIPAGGALLFPVFAGPRGAVAIAVESGWDLVWLENLGRAQLRALVLGDGTAPTPENLGRLNGWLFRYATRHVNAAGWENEIEGIGDVLYRELWRPLQERLDQLPIARQSELVWFPQGPSCVLPIHAARYPVPEGWRPITEDYALRYAPSAAILLSAPAEKQAGPCVLAANPQGDLPYSELELEWVKRYAGSAGSRVLTGTDASRAAVLAALPDAEIFHFSGHAFFRLDDPFQSCLGMAPPGVLTVEDLQPVLAEHPPHMVMLSACQTAMAQVTVRADEALGFPSMLLGHGVRVVLATLWPVDDLASAMLAGQFYRFWREEHQTPAGALRSAQNWLRTADVFTLCDLLRPLKQVPGAVGGLAAEARSSLFQLDPASKPFAHPMFWAAFVVAGT